MNKRIILLGLGLIILGAYQFFKNPTSVLDYKDHQYVSSDIQRFNGYTMTNLEPYEGEFRVFSTQTYLTGKESEISPIDFMVGWGEMKNPEIYKKINFSQSNRFGYWRTNQAPPLPVRDMERQVSNMHMIPANQKIAKQLYQVDEDDLIYLKGHLVEVKHQSGWQWRSSLSREDTGNGACELMLVTEVRMRS